MARSERVSPARVAGSPRGHGDTAPVNRRQPGDERDKEKTEKRQKCDHYNQTRLHHCHAVSSVRPATIRNPRTKTISSLAVQYRCEM